MKRKRLSGFFIITAVLVSLLTPATGTADVKVHIQEWDVPTPNSRPHDPAVGADGSLWYTGMQSNTLGRLDPNTGKIEEWASPGGPESRPYGIATTPDGVVWYSESGMRPNTIVRFDPRKKAFATWPIPIAAPQR